MHECSIFIVENQSTAHTQVELPKDDKKALEDDIQKLTDLNIKKLDEMAKAKTDEVMKI